VTVVRDRQTVTVTVTVGGSQADIGNRSLEQATAHETESLHLPRWAQSRIVPGLCGSL
jgi:hypothetical protein